MSGVPYIFANATTSIPLSQLDVNFSTPVTIGNTTVALGNVITSIGNLTLTGATIQLAANAAPAFSAYGTAYQSLANNTYTKIQYNTKDFDTNSNYDNTTNYRFTPTVAGYYQVTASINSASSALSGVNLYLYKKIMQSNFRILLYHYYFVN